MLSAFTFVERDATCINKIHYAIPAMKQTTHDRHDFGHEFRMIFLYDFWGIYLRKAQTLPPNLLSSEDL
jgi:hypothetical protein